MTLPGKHMEQLRLAPSQMLQRGQLKKPLRDILRDISKRSKANVDMRGGPGGSIVFEGRGSVDAVRQALKQVAQQVGSKVRLLLGQMPRSFLTKLGLAIGPGPNPYFGSPSHHRSPGSCCSGNPAADWCTRAGPSCRGSLWRWG